MRSASTRSPERDRTQTQSAVSSMRRFKRYKTGWCILQTQSDFPESLLQVQGVLNNSETRENSMGWVEQRAQPPLLPIHPCQFLASFQAEEGIGIERRIDRKEKKTKRKGEKKRGKRGGKRRRRGRLGRRILASGKT